MQYHYAVCVLLWASIIQAIPLFECYKELQEVIPHIQIAHLPTPVMRAHGVEKALQHGFMYIKRDDCTGSNGLYGGNKVRKLEFLLGDALHQGATKIITFGCVGTNHGLATACYACQLGLDCLLMLKHQPNSPVVRQNLLLDHYFNARIELFPNNEERWQALEERLAFDEHAYFFPTGGSVALGALGYVNAAFELKEQIAQGILPVPDRIYLPIGSCGTTAGLLLGLQIVGIPSRIIAVAVEPEEQPDEFYMNSKRLFYETNMLLHQACPEIPLYEFPDHQVMINKDFCGPDYGVWLPAGDDATRIMKESEAINLEGTYSAKAFAAVIADKHADDIQEDEVILLWNTYCGLDFSHVTTHIDYKELPHEIYHYFEEV